ncbi:HEAVY METAL ASSOCIATED PROTEIN 26 [Hibiscus trionum]|uniref:HEAVY METAL ASSOCIATED PROTEIN 26 n=1 Tax=Hibiscus trionum TaxID=183268 RepID=A0A9W7H3M5_HIBTR|nr:HEAVY METAL ASSOCIATED PROTEIN 26 [Hibiscus trionum]
MENEKKEDGEQIIVTEFEVSMHCNACERSVAKVIAKLKGVEKFTTDMNKNKVVVTGKIDPQKVLKKLRKKTGKKVEIVTKVEEKENGKEESSEVSTLYEISSPVDNEAFMMFSDENANACSVM